MAGKDNEVLVEVVKVRDFRADLKRFQDAPFAVVVGSVWHPRGIFIPIPDSDRWSSHDQAKTDSTLRKLFDAALNRIKHY